ncbi:S1 RNA binding family protein [Hungatella effluvii]|uniref:S1 RNA binding family protein n=1 Tax=Hungatella effluvii TaxID=1096246 RepID=A0A2V3Y816_9FIRM|nr:S1 RNA-binding domain-containing protein [Hungatella effluvii]PXX54313.1 S1 RNA binding family protein [Hungatella effluvii]
MARKKELMELENPSMGENTPLDGTDTETGASLTEGDGMPPETDGDGMDLNELLGSMDQEPAEGPDMEDGMLPELTEEEMFGEVLGDMDGSGTEYDAGSSGEVQPESAASPETDAPAAKTRRTTRSKKEKTPEGNGGETKETDTEMKDTPEAVSDGVPDFPDTAAVPDTDEGEETIPQEDVPPAWAGPEETPLPSGERETGTTVPPSRRARNRKEDAPVLTLEVRGEVETEESREDAIWHEIHNAYRTRRILTGQLGGIEQTDNGKTISIVDYKGFRIVIPLKEMMINIGRSPSGQEYAELMLRQNKILGNMLGAEIDFIVKGIDSKSRSVVASRKEAMLRKRQIFYLDTDAMGMYRIYEGRIAQARVIAVAEKVIRVEVFGVECSIMARDLAWEWIGDAHERFSVGDQVLVRILSVRRDSLEDMGIKADIKSVSQNTSHDNLKKCRIQSKYAGKVTDVHKGVVYIRLSNGVNAVAHSCYDYRTPGKKDDVSFAVTRLDEERGVAVGIITRIIRQNL